MHEVEALEPVEEIYRALVLGTRDYVTKNGFKHVVIGLSGGIDSSIVAAVAVDAVLPARAYVDSSWFALEMDRVFARMWLAAGRVNELDHPGAFVRRDVAGASLLIVRAQDGSIRAHHNVCRHRGARLCDPGTGHADRFFKCPYHSWAYDLDGKCLGTPLFTPDSEVPEDQRGIFDMDGVLFDTETLYEKSAMAAAREVGIELTSAFFRSTVGSPWPVVRQQMLDQYGPDLAVD